MVARDLELHGRRSVYPTRETSPSSFKLQANTYNRNIADTHCSTQESISSISSAICGSQPLRTPPLQLTGGEDEAANSWAPIERCWTSQSRSCLRAPSQHGAYLAIAMAYYGSGVWLFRAINIGFKMNDITSLTMCGIESIASSFGYL